MIGSEVVRTGQQFIRRSYCGWKDVVGVGQFKSEKGSFAALRTDGEIGAGKRERQLLPGFGLFGSGYHELKPGNEVAGKFSGYGDSMDRIVEYGGRWGVGNAE